MIVRIFRVVAHADRRDAFAEFFTGTALPLVRRQPGLVSVTAGLPMPDTPDEFSMVMIWRDVEALMAFAGEDWRRPHVHPDEEGIVKERHLHHYALAEG